jgi:multimeric flavodoxin WrbA
MSPNKKLVLKCSPPEKGNSAVLADQVGAGATAAGAEVESFVLQSMKIEPCSACKACHENPGNNCNIEDDMQILYPKLRLADTIVVATPIYWFTMSAQTQLCIDRWYALETRQGNLLRSKQFGILLTYGDTDLYTSGGINAIHTFESMFRYMKAEMVGIVHGSAMEVGDAEKQPALMDKAYQLGRRLGTDEM